MTYIAITDNESEYVKIILLQVRNVQRDIAAQKAHVLKCNTFEIDKTNPCAIDFYEFVGVNFKSNEYNEFERHFSGNVKVRLSIQPAGENTIIANSFRLEMQNKWINSSRYSIVKFWIDRDVEEHCNIPMHIKSWEDKLWYKLHIRKLKREKQVWLRDGK